MKYYKIPALQHFEYLMRDDHSFRFNILIFQRNRGRCKRYHWGISSTAENGTKGCRYNIKNLMAQN